MATKADTKTAPGRASAARTTGCKEMLYLLKLCRYFDERMEALTGRAGCPARSTPGAGRRARTSASRSRLEKDDSLFPTHRDLSAQLTKGLDLKRVMAQFWGRIDGYTRGRDGNSHIGDWDGNRTFTVISHLPDRLPRGVWRGARLQAQGRAPRRDGDLRRRVHVERPLARGAQLVGRPPAPRRVGREQQPVRVLHARTRSSSTSRRSPSARSRTACRAFAWTAATSSRCSRRRSKRSNAPGTAAGRR